VQLQQAREREQKKERDNTSRMVDNMSAMQAGILRGQQQNVAINIQIQNNQNFSMGYGS
jgi:deferrochelatase/peroxidase EfeB